MSGKLSDAERAAIRVEVQTNAHPREPETRYILGLLDHAAALEAELAGPAAAPSDAEQVATVYEKEIDYLRGQLVLERDGAALVLAERDAEIEELRGIIAGHVAQLADRREVAEWHQLATSVAALHQAKR